MGRLIDEDALIKCRVENDPVVIAAKSAPTAYDQDKVVEQLENYLFEKYCVEGDAEIDKIIKAGGNADLLMDVAKSKSGECIPYDGKWK